MILDTSFLIDIMDKEPRAVSKLHQLLARNEPQIITTVTLFEIWSGMSRSSKPEKEKTKILSVISSQTIWSLDQEGAQSGGEIDGTLAIQGRPIDPEDCMIAGMAKSRNQAVLSNDLHFERIKGLLVEHY